MNIKKTLARYLPQPHEINAQQHLKFLGERLHDPELWHLNRRSVAGGVSVGFFCAFIPIPMQMVLGALVAIALRVNLPVSIVSVWISNPLTFGPIFYGAYRIGAGMLDRSVKSIKFDLSTDWFLHTMIEIWQPLFLGCAILGVISAVVGNLTVRLLWRLHLMQRRKERRRRKTPAAP